MLPSCGFSIGCNVKVYACCFNVHDPNPRRIPCNGTLCDNASAPEQGQNVYDYFSFHQVIELMYPYYIYG